MTTELIGNEVKMNCLSGQESESQAATVGFEGVGEQELPDGVTEAPQHEEHMDLRKVQGHKKWVKTYLNVSDDAGDFLGDKKTERDVIKLCDDLSSMDLTQEEDPALWVNKITNLVKSYSTKISLTENTSIGIVTKYRIRDSSQTCGSS